jgi:hypothetical protein
MTLLRKVRRINEKRLMREKKGRLRGEYEQGKNGKGRYLYIK